MKPFPLALIPFISACAAVPAPSSQDAAPQEEASRGAAPQKEASPDGIARFGERTYVNGPHVTPVALVEDSRCPIDARCVWAGRLTIMADVETGAGTTRRELTLGKPMQIADGALELTEALPLPESNKQIEPGDYRFGFTFAGGI